MNPFLPLLATLWGTSYNPSWLRRHPSLFTSSLISTPRHLPLLDGGSGLKMADVSGEGQLEGRRLTLTVRLENLQTFAWMQTVTRREGRNDGWRARNVQQTRGRDEARIGNRAWSHEVRMKSGSGSPPSSPSCVFLFHSRKGKLGGGEGGRAAESEWRFGGREQGAESEGKLALGWTTQVAALHEKREKTAEILQKIEIILIRSDSACQWSMQTISVVTKRCGRYWACSVSRAAPTSTGCLAKGTEGHVAAASAPSARSGLPRFCTRSSPGGGVRAAPRLPGSELFFISCVVCLKIL